MLPSHVLYVGGFFTPTFSMNSFAVDVWKRHISHCGEKVSFVVRFVSLSLESSIEGHFCPYSLRDLLGQS